ncbi:MAG: hypothetical protein KDA69_13690 [Planctomycetaceae bacterium]|nr:hypothetical protein [Planctomycetaceae bacterium]MCA9045374.1 hypothetical protein [Planctomycetaceae bacterium]
MAEEELQPPSVSVDGDAIVVRNGAVLPMRCVFSNELVERGEMRTRTLYYIPWFVYLIIPVSLLLMYFDKRISGLGFIGLLVVMQRAYCSEVTLTYGVSSALLSSNRMLAKFASRFVLSGLVLLCAAIFVDAIAVLVAAGVTLGLGFLAIVATVFTGPDPGRMHIAAVQKYNADNRNTEFWIKGFHPDYLAQLREVVGEGD